jgi:phosphonoacetaldehyde hydrolase
LCAPLGAFHQAFGNAGLPITDEVARRPMGAHKRDHVREILCYPEITARVRAELKRDPDEALVDAIYHDFARLLPALIPAHADPIPGAAETLRWLHDHGIRIGSTTGYVRAMMSELQEIARAAGVAPEIVICADEVPQCRPAPWACFRIAEQCGVYPMSRCLKVGDTPADMAEGRNAGMICVGVSASGNEVGLSQDALAALSEGERSRLIEVAGQRLLQSGAHAVLQSIAELPAWIESLGS